MVDLNAVASKLASNRSGSVTNVLREKDSRSVTQMVRWKLSLVGAVKVLIRLKVCDFPSLLNW